LKKHNIFKQRGIISGDGISPNPKGILEYGRAFVPGDMAGKVQAPNFMDVINAAIADMRTTHNYQDEIPYIANVVMLNDIDFFLEVQSAKDTTGRPLFNYNPITQVATMGSVAVIPTPEIEAGNILVADVTKYNVVNYKPYTVRIGWVNDDFIKNQFVILGESRFYGFVKKLDEQAFIYDSIDTIKDALRLV
jgi:HK97 family phage major capsid protein